MPGNADAASPVPGGEGEVAAPAASAPAIRAADGDAAATEASSPLSVELKWRRWVMENLRAFCAREALASFKAESSRSSVFISWLCAKVRNMLASLATN